MKKIVGFILVLCLSFSTLNFIACGGGHTHTYSSEWTYDKDCHWHEATCEHTGYKSEKANHVAGDWIIEDADCTHSGRRYKVCQVCGYLLEEENIDSYHDLGDWIIDVAPDCTNPGSRHKECKVCHETLETENLDPLGHSFTHYVLNNDETREKDGTKTANCDREGCTATDTVTIPGSRLGNDGEWDIFD